LCSRGGYCGTITSPATQSADILFVIDNSGSMRQEQAALRAQFPRLIHTLTTGTKPDGTTFPPVHDIHLGVVSTDMGIVGVANNFPGCNSQQEVLGGDDGLLQHRGNTSPGCKSEYPPFLQFTLGADDPELVAQDFSCIADLGTAGCGFEQPLEAALKALWPENYIDANGNAYPRENNPIMFLSTKPEGRFGHGDTDNVGFLRNDPIKGLSTLAIVLLTDEEDCSSKDTSHFRSTNDPNDPLSKQGINLRCYYNEQNLYDLVRYPLGYKSLRTGREDTVFFSAIVGVPVDLVNAEAKSQVNFGDPASRDAFYDRILNDPRMQERVTNEDMPAVSHLAPSCTRTDAVGERSDAYPPRRIVEVAKAFGGNADVHSICQDDFGPAIDGLIDMTAGQTGTQCTPEKLVRDHDGKVRCDVIVELPPNRLATQNQPTACENLPYLSPVKPPRKTKNSNGGVNCKVAQLPVVVSGMAPQGEGFYYDDWSDSATFECYQDPPRHRGHMIAFSGMELPSLRLPTYLDCDADAAQEK
jgi:hypothetical protein